jgi:ribonuclease
MKHLLKLIALTFFCVGTLAPAQTIGSFTVGSAAVTPGGYVSLYAKNVTASSGAIAGVRFYRESNGTSGLQPGSDTYVGLAVYANGLWTFAAPTTGLSGTQTYYAVAYDTAGNASTAASVTASLSASGFSNWSTLQPFLAILPLSVGPISSTTVINNGTTIYTGPLDTTITLDRIRGDNGPNRSGDGAAFSNNGNPPLPTNRGNFYEFTVNPQTGCTPNWTTSQIAFPGPIRFMIDTSGDIYFTGDHYSTDVNLYIAGTPAITSVAASPSSATAGTAVTLSASGVSETISPTPSPNASTGTNVLATVSNVQFFLETNGTSGLQTDTDRLLGCGIQNGSTWTLTNVPTTGLAAGAYTVYALAVDPAGITSTQTTTLTITSGGGNQPPTVTTTAASGISTNTATLNGLVNPNNLSTTAQFLYGLTTNYNLTAAVVGTLTGSSAQAVSANLASLSPGTTYHFTLTATNSSGSVTGLDNTFTTASIILSAPTVTTAGASTITTNTATLNATVNPNNQATTAQFFYGLTTNYTLTAAVAGTLTGSSAQAVNAALTGLAPATTYHYVITATNASGSVTGVDQYFTTASPVTGGSGTNYAGILVGWDVSTLSGYGTSPLAPTTNACGLAIGGLTRGSGVGTSGTAAARAWGGNTFNSSTEAAAITAGQYATFTLTVTNGGMLTISNLARFDYRRSSTGPPSGVLQVAVGAGAFSDVTNFAYTVSTSSGASLGPVDLSANTNLQNIPAGSTVTFRLVNYGASSSGGTWYVYDVAASTALDFSVAGSINYPAPTVSLSPLQQWRQQWFGVTNNTGAAADTSVASSDGMPNLLKYALGLNPLLPATNPVAGDIATGFLRLTVPRNPNASDITYLIESVGDVTATWSTNAVVIDTNLPALLSGHDTNAVPATSHRFIRLHLTNP